MNTFSRIVTIVFCLILSDPLYAEEDSCYSETVGLFKDYHIQLKQPDSNTARFFNLSYLATEMKKVGVSKSEFGERLINYISNIDGSQSTVSLVSANAYCFERSARVIFRISDKNSVVRGEFIIVRLVERKIVNVSFQTSDSMIDGMSINDIDFKKLIN
jgi:hypothetical protein